jgi:hypothetical protein
MVQKGCECREGKMEEWKQNWDDEVCMDKVRRERGEKKRRKREKK